MNEDIEVRLVEHIDGLDYYDRYDEHGRYIDSFMKLREPLWFSDAPHRIFAKQGIVFDAEAAERLVDLFDGLDAYYYLGALRILGEDGVTEAIKWILGSISEARKTNSKTIEATCPVGVLREFVRYLLAGKFPKHHAREVFDRVLAKCPMYLPETITMALDEIVADPKFAAIDNSVLEQAVTTTLAALPDKVEEAKANPKLVQWFVGQVLKANKGLSPADVKAELERQLS